LKEELELELELRLFEDESLLLASSFRSRLVDLA
jgi:hypothetical protein